jgi:O-antigen ligase
MDVTDMNEERRPPLLPTTLRWLAGLAVVGFAALSVSSDSATRFYQWPWFFYWQVLLVAPVASAALWLLGGRPAAGFGGWLDAGLIGGTLCLIVSAALSPFPQQSLQSALGPLAAVALAYLVLFWVEQDSTRRAPRLARLAWVSGALLALAVFASLGSWLLSAWPAGSLAALRFSSRNAYPFGHSTYTAGFAVLAAPWLAGLALTGLNWRRWLWWAAAAGALALIPTTGARGGVLGIAVAAACAAALWLGNATLSRRQRLGIVGGALGLAAVFVALDPRLRALVRERRWSDTAAESNRQRTAMLEVGQLMGRDRPLTGYGPGTVSLVYPHYRAQLSGGVDNVLQLHSTPAQFWAELGLPGVLALVLALVGTARLTRGLWRTAGVSSNDPTSDASSGRSYRLRAQALVVALAGYFAVSLTDFQLDVPWFAATLAVFLALLRAYPPARPTPAPGRRLTLRRALGGLLLALLALTLWPTALSLRARQQFAEAADARVTGDEAAFVAGAERAATTARWDAFFPLQLAAFYGEKWLQSGDAVPQAQWQERFVHWQQVALARHPDEDYSHLNLGWLLLSTDPAEAEKHFLAAAHLSPNKGGVYLGLGLSRLGRPDPAAAIRAFALEWLNDPQAITAPAWEMPPLAALQPAVADETARLAAEWLSRPALPPETQRQLRYVRAFVDWWLGRSADTSVLAREGTPVQQGFFGHLDAIERRAYQPLSRAPEPWEQLYLAWRDRSEPPAKPTPEEQVFARALHRRIADAMITFADFVRAPVGGQPDLVQYVRRQRIGASVVLRNQDGFILQDLAVFPENRLVNRYLAFLFPTKGYLPAGALLGSLNPPPGSPR